MHIVLYYSPRRSRAARDRFGKGTNGVSTNGVAANLVLFDRGTFWVLPEPILGKGQMGSSLLVGHYGDNRTNGDIGTNGDKWGQHYWEWGQKGLMETLDTVWERDKWGQHYWGHCKFSFV